jgi:hypothetical protein
MQSDIHTVLYNDKSKSNFYASVKIWRTFRHYIYRADKLLYFYEAMVNNYMYIKKICLNLIFIEKR